MQTVLITGASGFLGSAIVREAIKEKNWDIYAVSSGRHPVSFPKEVRAVQADLRDCTQREILMETVRPDILLHLAWNLEKKGFLDSKTNILWLEASLHLMELFAKYGGKRMFFSGSSAEYGYAQSICYESIPGIPTDLYGLCKCSFTNIAQHFCASCGIEYVTGRFFSVYGPGETHLLHAIPLAINSLRNNAPFVCKGPNNCWDYIYIDDAARAAVQITRSHYCGVVNISVGRPINMKTVFSSIASEFSKSQLLSFENLDVPGKKLVGDNTILKDEVGICTFVPFEEGIHRTVTWWKKAEQ